MWTLFFSLCPPTIMNKWFEWWMQTLTTHGFENVWMLILHTLYYVEPNYNLWKVIHIHLYRCCKTSLFYNNTITCIWFSSHSLLCEMGRQVVKKDTYTMHVWVWHSNATLSLKPTQVLSHKWINRVIRSRRRINQQITRIHGCTWMLDIPNS